MTDLKLLVPAPRPAHGMPFRWSAAILVAAAALFVLGAAIIVLGAAFNWSWLLALGIAPLLVSALPCLAMCALGLCMHKMTSRSDNGA